MSTEPADQATAPVDRFPRERLLELLRQARHMLAETADQLNLLSDLRIPARVVLGRGTSQAPAVITGSSAPTAITAPALRFDRTDPVGDDEAEAAEDPPLQESAEADDVGYRTLRQRPASTLSSDGETGTPVGEELTGLGRYGGRPMPARRFAEALLDAVATPQYLDAAVVLGRRASSELAADQQRWWITLLQELESLRIENRRRMLAEGQGPDLGSLSHWMGFECLHHYSLSDRFFGREAYLEQIDAWVADGEGASVACLTALGGAGKSALAWRWLNAALTRLRGSGFRGALWCSFYEGTFRFDDFLRRTLAFCGSMQAGDVNRLSRGEVEEQLLEVLTRERFVLVVDGLERLMVGYAQTAERGIDDEGTRGGADRDSASREDRRMSDRRDGVFLRRLATQLATRVLLTSRLLPADLEEAGGGLAAHVTRFDLRGLSPGEAIALWNSILPAEPVAGEIARVLRACDYHPLAISVLARSVAAEGGGWDNWRWAPGRSDFDPDGPTAQARAQVIGACLRDLGAESDDVLQLLAVTGRPMREDQIEQALRDGSAAFGEERWAAPGRVTATLRHLVELGLVGEAVVDGLGEFDLHPVVRGAVWGAMTDPERASDRRVLLDKALTELTAVPGAQLAAEPTHLQRVASIFQVLVSTGELERAWEMFRYRMWWPLHRAGAHLELLELFEQLLPRHDPLQLLPLNARREQADAAELLGGLLMTAGDAAVADRLMVWSGVIRLRINDALGFLEVQRQQTWQSLYEGRLFDAELLLREVKVQAGWMGVSELFATVNPWIGIALALRGEHAHALDYLRVDEKDEVNHRWWVQGVAEGHLYLGDHAKALELLDSLPYEFDVDPLQDGWEQVTRGMAEVDAGEPEQAEEHLQAALVTARRSSYRIIQCFALVSLGRLAAARQDWSGVGELMAQYFAVDGEGAQRLTAGDAWCLQAMAADARGDRDEALRLAAAAYRTSVCDGPPFGYAAGVRRARDLLDRLGGYVPRTSSALRPEWRAELDGITAEEAEIDELIRGGARVVLIREGPDDRRRRRHMADLERLATDEERRWWQLVAGTDRMLKRWLAWRMASLEMSIGDLRRLFDESEEKSLEVVIFRLEAARLLDPESPVLLADLDAAGRAGWLGRAADHEAALEVFLAGEEAQQIAAPFRHQRLDARGVEAFSLDCRRRIAVDAASAEARRWWSGLEERRSAWDMLILAECIQATSATLEELVDAMSVTGSRGLEYGFLALRAKRAAERLRVTALSRCDGWPAYAIQLRLQTMKYQLGWLDLDDPARAFWTGIEQQNVARPALVLQLSEELALRGSSIPAYHEASLRSSEPDDPMATLAYLDYLRLADAPWEGRSWPDDVSVRRWSYDTATPTFRDLSSWTPEQIARWLGVIKERIGHGLATAKTRAWWDSLAATTEPATMVRLAEELVARQGDVVELYRAHIDSGSDNLLAVLSYVDYARLAKRRLSEDDTASSDASLAAGKDFFERNDFARAAEAYEAAIAADADTEDAYLSLAFTREQLAETVSAARTEGVAVLRRGLERLPGSTVLASEMRRFELGLPRPAPLDLQPVWVELSSPMVEDIQSLLGRVDQARQAMRAELGVSFPGILFRQNDNLAFGGYRILFQGRPVAEGTTVPESVFVIAPDVPADPRWPSERDLFAGTWQDPEDASPDALTPHAYLIRHLRVELAALAARQLTEQAVHALLEDGWSLSPLDPTVDLPLLVGLTEALRTLLDDQVPIVALDELVEEYRPLHAAGAARPAAAAQLRQLPDLRPHLPGNRPADRLLHLSEDAERTLTAAFIDGPSGAVYLTPSEVHAVLTDARALLAAQPAGPGDAVLVVSDPGVRRLTRLLLRDELPGLPVAAATELLARNGDTP